MGSFVYFNAIDNPFRLDDFEDIVENIHIRDTGNILQFFIEPRLSTNDPANAGHYRPLVAASYVVNYALGGLNPAGYHLVNLLFHVGSSFLVFLILQAIIPQPANLTGITTAFLAPFSAGLIYLIHPFNSEAINYVSARSSLMSGFFYLLAFYCWVKYRGAKTSNFYIFSLLAFVAGMLCKEVVITLPLVLWLYDLYFRGRGPSPSDSSVIIPDPGRSRLRTLVHWRTYVPYLPFVLIVMVPYLVIRLFSFGRVLDPFQRDLMTQLFTELPVLVRHWQMFFFPSGLTLIHDVEIKHSITMTVLFSGILILLYFVSAIYLMIRGSAKRRIVSFFMIWFIIVLLPTTIIPLNAVFQENRGYLAMVSFTVLAGVSLSELDTRIARVVMVVVLVFLLGAYSVVTVYRNTIWGDSVVFWKDVLDKTPGSGLAYAGLAAAYATRGDLFLAREEAKKGINAAPNNFSLRLNLGRIYQALGQPENAIEEYENALRISSTQVIVWNDLAALYLQKGDLNRSELYWRKVAEVWKDRPHVYYNLGVIAVERGRLQDAEGQFNKAISLSPSYFQARYELGMTLEKLGRLGEAGVQYQEIIRLASGESEAIASMTEKDRKVQEEIAEKARQRLSRGNGPAH